MQPALSPMSRRVLDPMLIGGPFGVDLEPAWPSPKVVPVPKKAEVPVDKEFAALLRANVQAAAQHVALGHQGPSFRECSRPACLDAAKLIPQLEEVGPGATDDELEALLDRVLATLPQGLPEVPAVRTRPARGGTSYNAPMAK